MSNSMALNSLGQFFHPVEIHTSTSRKPVDIHSSCFQAAAVAEFFTLTKYILQLVESRPTSIISKNVELSIYYSCEQPAALNHSFSLIFLIIYSTLTKYLLHKSKAGRHRHSLLICAKSPF